MTVDLLAATFWPEAALLDPRPAHPEAAEPAPAEIAEAAEEAARRAGFWSAMLRHLRPSPKAPAVS